MYILAMGRGREVLTPPPEAKKFHNTPLKFLGIRIMSFEWLNLFSTRPR